MIFFQLLDNILESINSRLHQKNIQFYIEAEEFILSSANKALESPEDRAAFARRIAAVCDHFGSLVIFMFTLDTYVLVKCTHFIV